MQAFQAGVGGVGDCSKEINPTWRLEYFSVACLSYQAILSVAKKWIHIEVPKTAIDRKATWGCIQKWANPYKLPYKNLNNRMCLQQKKIFWGVLYLTHLF